MLKPSGAIHEELRDGGHEPLEEGARRVETPDDAALMLRYRSGDAGAFRTLYLRHRGPLYRYFVRQAPRDAADDLYQETWLRVVGSAERYAPSAPFAAYLYRIAHNVLVDHFRRAGRTITEDRNPGPEPADPAPAPDAELDRAVLRKRLAAAIAALPAPQRDAFLLRVEADLTLEEIAGVVGAGRETVKSRLRYAVGRLREALSGDGRLEEST